MKLNWGRKKTKSSNAKYIFVSRIIKMDLQFTHWVFMSNFYPKNKDYSIQISTLANLKVARRHKKGTWNTVWCIPIADLNYYLHFLSLSYTSTMNMYTIHCSPKTSNLGWTSSGNTPRDYDHSVMWKIAVVFFTINTSLCAKTVTTANIA